MWWNLGFPATAFVIFIGLLRPKKRSTEKKTQRERLQKPGDSKVYACSDTDLGVMFCDKGNKDLSSKIYRVSFGGISLDLLYR